MASIEKRGKNLFRLVVEAGYDAKNKRIKRTKTIRIEDEKLLKTTRKLANYLEVQLHQFKQEVLAGEYIAPEKIIFRDFAEEFMNKVVTKRYSVTTIELYKNHLKNHINPVFGHKRLDQIKSKQIVDYIDQLGHTGARKDKKRGGLSDRIILDSYRVLKSLFKVATKE
ncbi:MULTISPECIES: tyrosine-type recombinase/integrase [Bacillus]|uniref:Core-binding (CB) domain-containing protein n=1 Tax=Bacillus capparidis TaxID=1840411 RepID=A0ABS4CTU2_9BACI|nr:MULTISPECIES: hypothetical protein [Bacillus]MBP1080990.1 hypothetical protein [Bacillus capparidis]MED1095687.1 hypothetical protein [Bacillus capparidis]